MAEIKEDPDDGIIIRGERPKQQVSRRSMTAAEIEETTASLGDPMNALTIFPGIERATGLTGDLVFRGLRPEHNRYYIDSMPVPYPVHFNGEHMVISTRFIKGVDVYSSAFPVQYGGALAGVVDITTDDDVARFSGSIDINMISNSLFFRVPITRRPPPDENGEFMRATKGYIMFGGRYNGLKYILDSMLYQALHPKEKRREAGNYMSDYKLEYWDYQVKAHYALDKKNSFSILGIGAGDNEFRSIENYKDERKLLMFHNQGLYYNYHGGRFKNSLLVYNSWSERRLYKETITFMYFFELTNVCMHTYFGSKKSNPNMMGVKNNFEVDWIKHHAQLRGEIEYNYTYYDFHGKNDAGYNYISIMTTGSSGPPYAIQLHYPYSIHVNNHSLGGYLDNRITWGGLEVTAGARLDYLKRSKTATVDPRGSVTYRFDTGTTLAGAAGIYSSFFQNNPAALFNEDPQYARAHYAKPERAIQAAVSVEQKIDLFTLSVEGFYCYLRDLFETYPHMGRNGSFRIGLNRGRMRSYGLEFLARKEKNGGSITWFGWLSYSLAFSQERSGLFLPAFIFMDPSSPLVMGSLGMIGSLYGNNYYNENMYWWFVHNIHVADISGSRWINADYERIHSLKIILGLTCRRHTISARFQLYTSFPHTTIVTSYDLSGSGIMNLPVYNFKGNTGHFPVNHRLDIQYDYKWEYERGHVRLYVGIIDVFAPINKTINGYKEFNPFLPYMPGKNPEKFVSHEKDGSYSGLDGVAPYLGCEITF
ncbi:MAG: TonB-dependent receptor plug domain-containing protein [Spirochaetes bacterium]|nr:TonB-dependent receptor plug domain-containing protein [Spirochaetota bacterium]